MNSKSSLPRPSCIYEGDQFHIERHAAASLEGDTHGKSNRKLICRIVDGLASGVRHQGEYEADMPAHSYAILRLRQRHCARQRRRQRCQYNPCSSHCFQFSFSMLSEMRNRFRVLYCYGWSASCRARSESSMSVGIGLPPAWLRGCDAGGGRYAQKTDLPMRIRIFAERQVTQLPCPLLAYSINNVVTHL